MHNYKIFTLDRFFKKPSSMYNNFVSNVNWYEFTTVHSKQRYKFMNMLLKTFNVFKPLSIVRGANLIL